VAIAPEHLRKVVKNVKADVDLMDNIAQSVRGSVTITA
jgi:hypothetical protein